MPNGRRHTAPMDRALSPDELKEMGYTMPSEEECEKCYRAIEVVPGVWRPCRNAGCAYHPHAVSHFSPQFQDRAEMIACGFAPPPNRYGGGGCGI